MWIRRAGWRVVEGWKRQIRTSSNKRFISTTPLSSTPPNVVLIDTSTLIFRAHHGFAGNPLTRSDGLEISALYGLCASLLMIIETLTPTHIACALDVKSSRASRLLLLPDYKGQRVKDENYHILEAQLKRVPDVIAGLGLKAVKCENHEADDVIASLVESIHAKHPDATIRIVSADKDFTQILREKPSVSLLKFKFAKSARVVDEQGRVSEFDHFTAPMCKQRYGIEVDQFVDYLALVGDVADNIPGVPKVGDKTAANLLNSFGNLDGILEAANDGKIKRDIIRNSLLNASEGVRIWRQVAKLNHDLDVPDLDELRFDGIQSIAPKMRRVFDEYHFHSHLDRLENMLQRDREQNGHLVNDDSNQSVNQSIIESTGVKQHRSTIVMDENDDDDDDEPHIIMRSGHFK